MKMRHLLRASASALVLSAIMSTAAFAQDEPAAADDGVNTVDTIVVTVNKREQNLQDVPATVTALSGELMQDAGVKDIKDLQILTPGLTVTSTSNETVTTARIRGVGTVGDNPGLESSVGIVIDGVYRPRNGVSFGDLGELQRIEVLKGPQGTLFGKNTSAGVINILTAEPEFEFGGNAELTFGEYGTRGGSVSVTGPIFGDNVAGRIFFAKRERDGFLNVKTGDGPRTSDEDVNQDFWTIRGQILATPSDDLSIRMIADYTERDEMCCLATQLQVGDAANSRAAFVNQVQPGGIATDEKVFNRTAYGNRSTRQFIQDKGFSAQVDWDVLDGVALTSITAVRNWRAETGQDSDFTAADLVYRPDDGTNYVEFGQFSQELRANGEAGPVNWLVGAFYASEDLDSRSRLNYGTDYYAYFDTRVLGGVPGLLGLTPAAIHQAGNGSDDRYAQTDETFALFTDNTWSITEAWKLTAGLRYSWSDKSLTTQYSTTGASCDQAEAAYLTLVGLAGAPTAQAIVGGLCLNAENNDFDALGKFTQKRSEEELTGTIKLAWNINDDIMTYASYARGYKSGGFNLDRSGITCPYPGRSVKGPAGLACINGSLLTPLDFQANKDTSFDGEKADSYELGIKTKWLGNSLLLNATAFYQKYTDFQLNTFVGTAFIVESIPELTSQGIDADFLWFTPLDGLTFQGGVTWAQTKFGEFTAADLKDPSKFNGLFRLPGATAPFAPRWSASLATSYEKDIGEALVFKGNVSLKYTSDYNTGSDLHPVKEQEAFTLVNARVGIGSQDGLWTVELYANNLFDKDYTQVAFNGPFQVDTSNPYLKAPDDAISTYDAFLGAPRVVGVTLRSKF
ncbi:TonB-dependent receptor [Caulobacter sp. NIBR1757]|uniref:TonB-dependent receptor n=1 Tax=Caulobacter sp. NIBR1757 TaxID=3016000 RepID=UPI0022F0B5D5|nr:TonB-dependent receptor [Caulobacter sp. NIBR1757]WGM37566.1 Vitamin B12 transporter BtuB [Caulobacter sp. NIBR1757]